MATRRKRIRSRRKTAIRRASLEAVGAAPSVFLSGRRHATTVTVASGSRDRTPTADSQRSGGRDERARPRPRLAIRASRVQSLSLHRASGTPAETDAAAVVAAVEAERPELPLAVAHPVNRARILVRVGIEDVLRLEQAAVGAQYATSPTSCRWLSTAGARRSCSCRPTRTRRRARSARGARSTRRCGPRFSLLAAPSRWSSWAVTRCDWRRPSGRSTRGRRRLRPAPRDPACVRPRRRVRRQPEVEGDPRASTYTPSHT